MSQSTGRELILMNIELQHESMQETINAYRKALEFYADKENYEITGEKVYTGHGDFHEETWIEIDRDHGEIARRVLEERHKKQ